MATLLVSEIFPPKTGGSGRWFWEIYGRLPRSGYCVAAGEDARQDAFDRTHDLRVKRVPLALSTWGLSSLGGLRGYWRAVRRLRRIIREERVDRLHCARCLPEGLMAWILRRWTGVPYICYAHGEEINYASTSRELSWLMRRSMRGADFVIANSRNTAGILLDEWRLPEDRVRILHPGVDTERFRPAEHDEAAREALGWRGRRVILTVGRLQRRKGQDAMIRALGRIAQAVPDVLYAIVGEGEERASLEALAVAEGHADRVRFLGETRDEQLIRCYQQCDLFALPNRQVGKDIEGFGMVLLEAQACGKPVLAGASGGTAETMRVPETGRIVPCETPDALADVVIELLSNPERRERMGLAAREWVTERFDWEPLSRHARRLFEGEPTPARARLLAEPVRT